jgi:hypothetical protein
MLWLVSSTAVPDLARRAWITPQVNLEGEESRSSGT